MKTIKTIYSVLSFFVLGGCFGWLIEKQDSIPFILQIVLTLILAVYQLGIIVLIFKYQEK